LKVRGGERREKTCLRLFSTPRRGKGKNQRRKKRASTTGKTHLRPNQSLESRGKKKEEKGVSARILSVTHLYRKREKEGKPQQNFSLSERSVVKGGEEGKKGGGGKRYILSRLVQRRKRKRRKKILLCF